MNFLGGMMGIKNQHNTDTKMTDTTNIAIEAEDWAIVQRPANTSALEVGETFMLGVDLDSRLTDPKQASLWRLSLTDTTSAYQHGAHNFASQPAYRNTWQQMWQHASAAALHALPFLTHFPAHRLSQPPQKAVRVISIRERDYRFLLQGEALLEGHSYELPMALLYASVALNTPIPRHVFASGSIDQDGYLGEVLGVQQKRILAFKAQEELCLEQSPIFLCKDAPQYETVRDVIQFVFRDAIEKKKRILRENAGERFLVVRRLFDMLLFNAQLIDYNPILALSTEMLALHHAQQLSAPMDTTEQFFWQNVQAIARRSTPLEHLRDVREYPLQTQDLPKTENMCLDAQWAFKAHIIQHLARNLQVSDRVYAEQVLQEAKEVSANLQKIETHTLRLRGAYARYLNACYLQSGSRTDADKESIKSAVIAYNFAVLQAFLDRMQANETSYALSELYDLVQQGDTKLFKNIEQKRQEIEMRGGLQHKSEQFTLCAHAKASHRLDPQDNAALHTLRYLREQSPYKAVRSLASRYLQEHAPHLIG